MKTVCIISHQHLSRNPRVLKESLTLKKVGFHVIILTSIYSHKLFREDIELIKNSGIAYTFYNDLRTKKFLNYIVRAKNKIGRYLNRIGIENRFALGYAPGTCLSMSIKSNADLFICHQELPTYVGTSLLKIGKKVAFDIEDWYTEDLLPNAQKFRPQFLLKKCEETALKNGNAVFCTSSTMAVELSKFYNTKEPNIIYNSFKTFSKVQIKKSKSTTVKLIWISQTIGPGRGLEEIIEALNQTNGNSVELSLRGNISTEYQKFLQDLLTKNTHSLVYLPVMPNDQIQSDLVNFDIGLASEPNYPKNKDLTISNKIFHYLSVGLPVVASSTKGQLSLKDDFPEGILYYQNSDELVSIFSSLNKKDLQNKRAKILDDYQKKYDWSLMEKELQNIVKHILS